MYPSASVFCIIGQFRRSVHQRKIPPVRVKRPSMLSPLPGKLPHAVSLHRFDINLTLRWSHAHYTVAKLYNSFFCPLKILL